MCCAVCSHTRNAKGLTLYTNRSMRQLLCYVMFGLLLPPLRDDYGCDQDYTTVTRTTTTTATATITSNLRCEIFPVLLWLSGAVHYLDNRAAVVGGSANHIKTISRYFCPCMGNEQVAGSSLLSGLYRTVCLKGWIDKPDPLPHVHERWGNILMLVVGPGLGLRICGRIFRAPLPVWKVVSPLSNHKAMPEVPQGSHVEAQLRQSSGLLIKTWHVSVFDPAFALLSHTAVYFSVQDHRDDLQTITTACRTNGMIMLNIA